MTKRLDDPDKTQLLLGNNDELNLSTDDLWYANFLSIRFEVWLCFRNYPENPNFQKQSQLTCLTI